MTNKTCEIEEEAMTTKTKRHGDKILVWVKYGRKIHGPVPCIFISDSCGLVKVIGLEDGKTCLIDKTEIHRLETA